MDLKALLTRYVNSSFHRWWVDKVWRPSWTNFLTFVYGIPSALGAVWLYLVNASQDDKLHQLLASMNIPDGVLIGLAGIALVHYLAKGHDD